MGVVSYCIYCQLPNWITSRSAYDLHRKIGSEMATESSRKMGEVDHEQYPVELLIQQGRCRLKRFEANTCHRIYFANCNKFITFAV